MLCLSKLIKVIGKLSLLFHFPRNLEKDVRSIEYQLVLLHIELWARSEPCVCAGCLVDKPSSDVIFCGILTFFSPLRFIIISFQLCFLGYMVRDVKDVVSALFVHMASKSELKPSLLCVSLMVLFSPCSFSRISFEFIHKIFSL